MIIKKKIVEIFNVFYIILLINIIFFTLPNILKTNILTVLFLSIVIGVAFVINKYLKGIWIKNFNYIVLLICFLAFLCMIYISANNVYIPKKGDYEAIYTGIKELNEIGHFTASLEYYLNHPHQLFTTIFYSVVNRIFMMFGSGATIDPLLTSYLNSFLTITGIYLTVQASKILFSKKFAHLILFILLSHVSYYISNVFIYTHVLSVFALGVFLFLFSKSETNEKYKNILLILLGVSFAIATIIEGIFNVGVIALVIYLFLKYDVKESLKKTIVILISFILTLTLVNAVYDNIGIFNSTERENQEIPYYHWMMMGFSETGIFQEEDYAMTVALDTTEERSEITKEILIERIKSRTPTEMYEFLMEKQEIVWRGSYYGVNTVKTTSDLHLSFRLTLIIGLFLSVVLNYKDKNITAIKFFEIWAVGIILFICIWEVSSIYLYSSTLMLAIPACNGYFSLFKKVNQSS